MRLFLAINLAPNVRRAVADAIGPLRAEAPSVKWVDETRLHLTLKFLGEQPDDVAHSLAGALSDVARRHRTFNMRLTGVGAFPNFRRARVVWFGVAPEARLELLHHDVEVACESLGFALEGRAFRPHITLARLTDKAKADELRRLEKAGKKVILEEESAVQSIDVMRSVLGASARYERLHAAQLRDSA